MFARVCRCFPAAAGARRHTLIVYKVNPVCFTLCIVVMFYTEHAISLILNASRIHIYCCIIFGQTAPDHLILMIDQIRVSIFRIHHIFGILHLVPIHVTGKQEATLLL